MTDISRTRELDSGGSLVDRLADYMQPFYKSWFWRAIFLTFICVDSFIAIPQLLRVIATPEITGLSLETFSAAALFGLFLIFYGIEQRKIDMPIAGVIGFGLNAAIVSVALSKGVQFF